MDCNLPGSSVHGVLQARIQEWVAISSSRGPSQPKGRTHVSYGSCGAVSLQVASLLLSHWENQDHQRSPQSVCVSLTKALITDILPQLLGTWYIKHWARTLDIPREKKLHPLPPFTSMININTALEIECTSCECSSPAPQFLGSPILTLGLLEKGFKTFLCSGQQLRGRSRVFHVVMRSFSWRTP